MLVRREPAREFVERRLVAADDQAAAVDANDPRFAFEGTEHEDYAAVLAQVGDGLDAAAGPVEVGDAMWVEYSELAVVALR